MPWVAQEPEAVERKAARIRRWRAQFDAGEDFVFGMFDPDEKTVLGGIGLHRRIGAGAAEIGYWVHVDHVNQGYATEAAAALTRVGFQVERLVRIEIHTDPHNVRSAAIPRKLGFVHQVTVPGWIASPKAEPRDTMFWRMLRREFPSSPAAAYEAIEASDASGAPLRPRLKT